MTTDKDDDDSRNSAGDDDEARARKRKERLEQNRISARESRKRKKTMIEELQRTVITLSRENKDLNERNDSLRRQLMEIGAKVSNLPRHIVLQKESKKSSQGRDLVTRQLRHEGALGRMSIHMTGSLSYCLSSHI
jgi:uncharacterized protein (DUF3084 family)